MYVDIVISNAFNLNLKKSFLSFHGYTRPSYKISIMICTKLTKADCTAINNSYKIIKEDSTTNNMHYCCKL